MLLFLVSVMGWFIVFGVSCGLVVASNMIIVDVKKCLKWSWGG